MARYGVLGDIHGNREALAAALNALDACGAQRIVCLGDVVGYNADPDECVALVRRRCSAVIAGDHDRIGAGQLDFRRCSNDTEYSLRRTRRVLSRESIAWLASLPRSATLEEGVVLVHGGVPDLQDGVQQRGCFFAQGQEQKVYRVHADSIEEIPAHGQIHLRQEDTYFIHPGSVDASRKRSRKLAECALFDSGAGTLEFLRVPYDGAATEAKAAVFGYRITPLTDRLYSLRRKFGVRAAIRSHVREN